MGALPSPQRPASIPTTTSSVTELAWYRHDVSALSQPQGRKETGNAEHVVEMAVSQQEPIEPSKAGAAAQQLALRPFSAIHQNTVTSGLDEETGKIPFGRRNACRRP
jgi:hypothetical protein